MVLPQENAASEMTKILKREDSLQYKLKGEKRNPRYSHVENDET